MTWRDTKLQGCRGKNWHWAAAGDWWLYLHCHGHHHHVMCGLGIIIIRREISRLFTGGCAVSTEWPGQDDEGGDRSSSDSDSGPAPMSWLYSTPLYTVLYTLTMFCTQPRWHCHCQPSSRNRMGRVHAWTTSFFLRNKALTWQLDPYRKYSLIKWFPDYTIAIAWDFETDRLTKIQEGKVFELINNQDQMI